MLTTVRQVRDFLVGISEPPPAHHDPLLTFFIQRLSGDVEHFCRRSFALAPRTDIVTGTADQLRYLDHWPVTAITSVTLDGTVIPAGTGAGQYRQVTQGTIDPVTALFRAEGWASGPYGLEIVYEAGYVLPADPDPSTRNLPYDLEGAVVELVAAAYLQRGKAGLAREAFEGLSLDFDRWPQSVVMTLRKYQRPQT